MYVTYVYVWYLSRVKNGISIPKFASSLQRNLIPPRQPASCNRAPLSLSLSLAYSLVKGSLHIYGMDQPSDLYS